MLKPSYSELMQVLNNDPDLDSKITSRYAVVIAASKRARQLIDGSEPRAEAETNKAVSIAVMEMNDGLIKIIPEGTEEPLPEDSVTQNVYFEQENEQHTAVDPAVNSQTDYADAYDQFDQYEDDDFMPDDNEENGLEDDDFDEE